MIASEKSVHKIILFSPNYLLKSFDFFFFFFLHYSLEHLQSSAVCFTLENVAIYAWE